MHRDGFPGVTRFRSASFDPTPGSWPHGEDFHTGVAKPDFRAPVRAAHQLAHLGECDNDDASHLAMTFAALPNDRAQVSAPRSGPCGLAGTAPVLLGEPHGDPAPRS